MSTASTHSGTRAPESHELGPAKEEREIGYVSGSPEPALSPGVASLTGDRFREVISCEGQEPLELGVLWDPEGTNGTQSPQMASAHPCCPGVPHSSACMPGLSHAVKWACPQPCSWTAAWISWTDLGAQEDIRTRRVLLVSAGMMGLCFRGRSSQQVDGPIGDNPIVVICQRPPAPPVPGALLSTKPREG